MRPLRRWWTAVGLAGLLAAWALVLAAPIALVGAIGIGGWLLAQQYRFARRVDRTIDGLSVGQSPVRRRVTAGETTPVTVVAGADGRVPVDLTIVPSVPAGVEADPPRIALARGEGSATETFTATWPVAGTVTLGPGTVIARDDHGLFEQSVAVGRSVTVTVEPRAPTDVHVGEGGDRVAAAFGDHEAGRLASGIEPAEVRRYVPGDSFRHVDWKATARLGEVHVREFEGEGERTTVIVFDHRAAMAAGPAGERKLDYAREVALAYVDSARDLSDPLGCYTVGDEGLTGAYEPRADVEHQSTVRTHLRAIEPTESSADADRSVASAARARRLRDRLDEDRPFDRTLRPFLDRPNAYVERIADRPLFRAVRSIGSRVGGAPWYVIVTDDTHRTELREAVRVASRGHGGVLVFLTPSALFEPAALGDVEAAYERYVSFEEFRGELAALPDVWAFEVGPGDRLSAILAAGTTDRRPAAARGWEA